MMIVTVYTRPGCGPCAFTKAALTRAGLQFTELSGDALPASTLAEVQARGVQMTAPLVVVTDGPTTEVIDIWSGARPDKISALTAVA